MDTTRFDALVKRRAQRPGSRRRLLTMADGGALAAVLGRPDRPPAAACGKPGMACERAGDCCAGAVCKRGTYRCARGTVSCDGRCRDLSANRAHCGACGRACPAGQPCVAGFCASAFGGEGSGEGQFSGPSGIAIDPAALVHVADVNNDRIQVLDQTGAFVRAWGTFGTGDGAFVRTWGAAGSGKGEFAGPVSMAVDGGDNVYVVETGNVRVQQFTAAGHFLRAFGRRGDAVGEFAQPFGVATDANGTVFVADIANDRIQRFDPA